LKNSGGMRKRSKHLLLLKAGTYKESAFCKNIFLLQLQEAVK
jgi:hypothetical protein